jgi:hypothetical protein
MRALAPVALLAAVALAGCLSAPNVQPNALPNVGDLLKPATTPLWDNPQTTPHPLFGFPTLTSPATGLNVPTWWKPINASPLPDHITGISHLSETVGEVDRGAGMSVFGSLAVVPGYTDDTHILDITDPEHPKVVGSIPEERHRNVDFIAFPNGRLIAVFATGNGTIPVWDITHPEAPVRISEFKPTSGTHKINIVPGTPIVYNANSDGGGCVGPNVNRLLCFEAQQCRLPECGAGITEIYDLTDPENPVLVQDWKNGFGCHHIYFWLNQEQQKYRAICAGIEFTQIWDIADPRNPEVIVNVPVHHGNKDLPSATLGIEAFSHFSILNRAGDILIVGDESGGGGLPPGCAARLGLPVGDATTPLGAIWFYDVSDETNPRLLSWWSPGTAMLSNGPPGPETPFQTCTAHHGRLVPDAEGRQLLAMAFYAAGTVLVDFSDPGSPHLIDQWNEGTDTWEVQYYNGYLFTGDMARGMDVFTFE